MEKENEVICMLSAMAVLCTVYKQVHTFILVNFSFSCTQKHVLLLDGEIVLKE